MTDSNCHKAKNDISSRSLNGGNGNLKLDLEALKLKCLEMKASVVIERLDEQIQAASPNLEGSEKMRKHLNRRCGCRKREDLKDGDTTSKTCIHKDKMIRDRFHRKQMKKSGKLVNTATADNGVSCDDTASTRGVSTNDQGKLGCNLMIVDVRGNALNEFECFDEEMGNTADGETTEEETTFDDMEYSIPFSKAQFDESNFSNFAYTEMKQEDPDLHSDTEKVFNGELRYVIKKEKEDYEDDYRTPSDTDVDYFSDSQKEMDEDTTKLFLDKENHDREFISDVKFDKNKSLFEVKTCDSKRNDEDRDHWDHTLHDENSRASFCSLKSTSRRTKSSLSCKNRTSRFCSKDAVGKNSEDTKCGKRKLGSNYASKTETNKKRFKRGHFRCEESALEKKNTSPKKELGRKRGVSRENRSLKGKKQMEHENSPRKEFREMMTRNSSLRESRESKNVFLLKTKKEPIENDVMSDNNVKQNSGHYLREKQENMDAHIDDFKNSIAKLSSICSQLEMDSSKEQSPTTPDKLSEKQRMLDKNDNSSSNTATEKKRKRKTKRKPSSCDYDPETNISRLKRDLPHFNWLETKIMQAHGTSVEHESEMDRGKSCKQSNDDGKIEKGFRDQNEEENRDREESKFKRRRSKEESEKNHKRKSDIKQDEDERKGEINERRRDDGIADIETESGDIVKKQNVVKNGKRGKRENGRKHSQKWCKDIKKEKKERKCRKTEDTRKEKRRERNNSKGDGKIKETQKEKGRERNKEDQKEKRNVEAEVKHKEKGREKIKAIRKRKGDGKMEDVRKKKCGEIQKGNEKKGEVQGEKSRENFEGSEKEKHDEKMKKDKSGEKNESQNEERDEKTEEIRKRQIGENVEKTEGTQSKKLREANKEIHKEKLEEKTEEMQRKKITEQIKETRKEILDRKIDEMPKSKDEEGSGLDFKHIREVNRSVTFTIGQAIIVHETAKVENENLKVCEILNKISDNESKHETLNQENIPFKTTEGFKILSNESKEGIKANNTFPRNETANILKNVSSCEKFKDAFKLCELTDILCKEDMTKTLRREIINKTSMHVPQMFSNVSQAIVTDPLSQKKANRIFSVPPDNLNLKVVPLPPNRNSLLFISKIPVPATPPLLLQGINVPTQNIVKNQQVQEKIIQPKNPTDVIACHQQITKQQFWLAVVPEKQSLVSQQTLFVTGREVTKASGSLNVPASWQMRPSSTAMPINSDANRNSVPIIPPPLTDFRSPYYVANNNSIHRPRSWSEPIYKQQQVPPTNVLQDPIIGTAAQNPQSQQQHVHLRKRKPYRKKSRELRNFLFFRMIQYPREAVWYSKSENDALTQEDTNSAQRKRRRRPLRPEECILIALTCSEPFYCDSSCQQDTFSQHSLVNRSESTHGTNLKSFDNKRNLSGDKVSDGCIAESEISNCDQIQYTLNALKTPVRNGKLNRKPICEVNLLESETGSVLNKNLSYLSDGTRTDLFDTIPECNFAEKYGEVIVQSHDLTHEILEVKLKQPPSSQQKIVSDEVTNGDQSDVQKQKLRDAVVNDDLKQSVRADEEITEKSVSMAEKVNLEVSPEIFNSMSAISEEAEKIVIHNEDSERRTEDVIQSPSNQFVGNIMPPLGREEAENVDGKDKMSEEKRSTLQQQKMRENNDIVQIEFNCTPDDDDDDNASIVSLAVRNEIFRPEFTEKIEGTTMPKNVREETVIKENSGIEIIMYDLERENIALVNDNPMNDSSTLQLKNIIPDFSCKKENNISKLSENCFLVANVESDSELVIDIHRNENEKNQISESCSVLNEMNMVSNDNICGNEESNLTVDIEFNFDEDSNHRDYNKNVQTRVFRSLNEVSGVNKESEAKQAGQESVVETEVERERGIETCESKPNADSDYEDTGMVSHVISVAQEAEIKYKSHESSNYEKLKEMPCNFSVDDTKFVEVATVDIIQNSPKDRSEVKNVDQIQESKKEKGGKSSNEIEHQIQEDAKREKQEVDRLKCHVIEEKRDHSSASHSESLPFVFDEVKSLQSPTCEKLSEGLKDSCTDLQDPAAHEDEVTVIRSLYQMKEPVSATGDANYANYDLVQCNKVIKNAQTEITSLPKEVISSLEKESSFSDGDCFIENEIKRTIAPTHIQKACATKSNVAESVSNEENKSQTENGMESTKTNQSKSGGRTLTVFEPTTKSVQNLSPSRPHIICSTMNSAKEQNATNAITTPSSKSHQDDKLSVARSLMTEISSHPERNVITVGTINVDQSLSSLSKDLSEECVVTKCVPKKNNSVTPISSHDDASSKNTDQFFRKTSAFIDCSSELNKTQKKDKFHEGTNQKIAYVKPSTARDSCLESSDVHLSATRRLSNTEDVTRLGKQTVAESEQSSNTSASEQAVFNPNSVTMRKINDSDWLYNNRDLDYEILYENVQKDSLLLPKFSSEINRRREELRILNVLAKRKEAEFLMLQNLRKSKMKLLHTLKEHYCLTRNLYQDEIRNYFSLDVEIDNLFQKENADKFAKLDEALQEIYEDSSPVTALNTVQFISMPLENVHPPNKEKNASTESDMDSISSLVRDEPDLQAPEITINRQNTNRTETLTETATGPKNSTNHSDPCIKESRQIGGFLTKRSSETFQETQENNMQNLTRISSNSPCIQQNTDCLNKQIQGNLYENRALKYSFVSTDRSQDKQTSSYQSQRVTNQRRDTTLESREHIQEPTQRVEFVKISASTNSPEIELLKQNTGYTEKDRLNSTKDPEEIAQSSFASKYLFLESSNSKATQEGMEPHISSQILEFKRAKSVQAQNNVSDSFANYGLRELIESRSNGLTNNSVYNKTPTEHVQSGMMAYFIPERPVQPRTPHPRTNPNQHTIVSHSSNPGRPEEMGRLCSGTPLRINSSQTLKSLERLQLICPPQKNNVYQLFVPVSTVIQKNEVKVAQAPSSSAPLQSFVSPLGVKVANTVTTNSEFVKCQNSVMPLQNQTSYPLTNEKLQRLNPAVLQWQLPFYNSKAGCSKSDIRSNRNSPLVHYSVSSIVDNPNPSLFPNSKVQHPTNQKVLTQLLTKEVSPSPAIKSNQHSSSNHYNNLTSAGLKCVKRAHFQNVQPNYSPNPPRPFENFQTSALTNDNRNSAGQNTAPKNQEITRFPTPEAQSTHEGKQRQYLSDPGREFGDKDKPLAPTYNREGQLLYEIKDIPHHGDHGRNFSRDDKQLLFFPNPGGQSASGDKRHMSPSNLGTFAPGNNTHEEKQLQSFPTQRQFAHGGRQVQNLQNEGGKFVHQVKQVLPNSGEHFIHQNKPVLSNPEGQFAQKAKQVYCLPNPGGQFTQEGKQVHCLPNPGGQFAQDPKLTNTTVQRLKFSSNGKELTCFYNPRIEANSTVNYHGNLQKHPGECTANNVLSFGSTQQLCFDPIEQKTIKYQSVQHQKSGQLHSEFLHRFQSSEDQRNERAAHYCSLCLKEAYFVCSSCKNEWYCSKKCQEERWISHSLMCNQFIPT